MISATPAMLSHQTTLKQMRDLSEFTMLVLIDRAARRGVQNVDYLIRDGQILDQLRVIVTEFKPDMVVIGKPVSTSTKNRSIAGEDLNNFIHEIEKQPEIIITPVEIEVS
jgi:RNase H-fold protein (predicted Holliday junction resolvase)